MNKQKTHYAKSAEITHEWVIIDAADQILGRVAAKAASLIRGKENPEYTPGVDTGAFVVIINSDKIAVTGQKVTDKKYYRHSGYPGGLKTASFKELKEKDSRRIIELAVKGMLPHNRSGRKLFTKLKVYAGAEHPHEAQQPRKVTLS